MRTSRQANTDLVLIKGNLDRETDKAIMIKEINTIILDAIDYVEDIDNVNKLREQWFTLSQVSKIHRSNIEGKDELHVSMWICKQKGLM